MSPSAFTPHHRRERLLRITLGFVAVLFIAVGFATPQIVQAVEYQSRGDFVSQLEAEQEALATVVHDNDLSTILLGLRVHELQQVERELSRLSEVLGEEFPVQARTALTDSTTHLGQVTSALETYLQDPLVTQAVQHVSEALELEAEDAEPDVVRLHAVSWFTATTTDIAVLFNTPAPTYTAPTGDLGKMTHSDFGAIKEELSSVQVALTEAKRDKEKLETDLESLNSHIEAPLDAVRQLFPVLEQGFSELEAPAEYYGYDLERVSSALDDIRTLTEASAFTINESGIVSPRGDAREADGDEVHEIGATRHAALLSRDIRRFIPQLAESQEALALLEEEERLILEEIERQREAERLRQLELSQNQPHEGEAPDPNAPGPPPEDSTPDPSPDPGTEPDPEPDPTPAPDVPGDEPNPEP